MPEPVFVRKIRIRFISTMIQNFQAELQQISEIGVCYIDGGNFYIYYYYDLKEWFLYNTNVNNEKRPFCQPQVCRLEMT